MWLIDWFKGLVDHQAKHLVYAPIASPNTSPEVEETELVADEHYFCLWLSEMFLADDVKWFSEFVPVVHSVIELQVGGKPGQVLPQVAGPLNLGLKAAVLGKGVQLNYQLTNLIPYTGGFLSVSAALLAYKKKDYLKEAIDIASSVSGVLVKGSLSSALEIMQSTLGSVQALLNAGDKDVRLVMHQGYGGGSPLKSGYFAIINADANDFDTNRLYVKNSRLHQGDSLYSCTPLTGYDYMLFRIAAPVAREEFISYPQIQTILIEAIKKGRQTTRQEGLAMLEGGISAVFDSADLSWADKLRIMEVLFRRYEQAVTIHGFVAPSPINMKTLNEDILSIDAKKALSHVSKMLKEGPLKHDQIFELVKNGKFHS